MNVRHAVFALLATIPSAATAQPTAGLLIHDVTLIDSWPEAIAELDAHIARQPDMVKFTFDEHGWGTRPLIPLLDAEVMAKAARYFNEHGIRTTVHISHEYRARQAIAAGLNPKGSWPTSCCSPPIRSWTSGTPSGSTWSSKGAWSWTEVPSIFRSIVANSRRGCPPA